MPFLLLIEFGHVALTAQMQRSNDNEGATFGLGERADVRNPHPVARINDGLVEYRRAPEGSLGGDGKKAVKVSS